MNDSDTIFAGLPELTKKRLLSDAALRRHAASDGLFETADQFNAREEPPLSFLIDGLLARGQLVMLGGRSKAGKSWLVAQMAQALDTGKPFLGRAVTPARVLYLPLEDKRARLKRRAKLLGWTPQTTMFHYSIGRFNGPNNTFGPGLELIERVGRDFDVILIDTLIATLDGNISENDNTSMGAIVNELTEICRGLGCAIVLVHHTGKGMSDDVFNLLRGASAIRGAYDVGLLMDRRQGEREAVLHIEARDFEGGGLTIRQKDDGSGWDVVGEAKEREKIRAGRRVINALHDYEEGATAEDLAEVLAISKVAVGKQLKAAERDGHVVVLRMDRNTNGRPATVWGIASTSNKNGVNQPALIPPVPENG